MLAMIGPDEVTAALRRIEQQAGLSAREAMLVTARIGLAGVG